MNRSPDWQWFGDNPERCHHARLATAAEVAALDGLDVATLADGCFVYAISRIIRDSPPLAVQTLFVVPAGEMDEAECRQAWHDAEGMVGAQITRQVQ